MVNGGRLGALVAPKRAKASATRLPPARQREGLGMELAKMV